MVFSSIPVYLDPSNWQQANSQLGVNTASSQLTSLHVGSGPTSSNIRPASMSERARLANIPMPETALKCPRCESTNTKFCYFNNYNLTQPRHFCKTCRRYWTRGGALRSVPVGGGCRRNKRSKSSGSTSSSKSTRASSGTAGKGVATTTVGCAGSSSTSTTSCGPTSGIAGANLLGLAPQIQPIRIMAPMSQLGEFNPGTDIGFHYGSTGINSGTNHDMINNFPFGGSYGVDQPWRFQHCQFSSMAGLEGGQGGAGMFPFHNMEHLDYGSDINRAMPKLSINGISTPLELVKMEDNIQEMNLSRQFLGFHGNDHHQQYHYSNGNWASGGASTGTCSWTDLSGFSSSSANSNPM